MATLQALLTFLNANSGALNTIFAFVVAAASAVYAVLKYRLAKRGACGRARRSHVFSCR
jgi:hypothetical protein